MRRTLGMLAVAAAAAGCGDGRPDDGVTVTGRVTLDGEPVPKAQVVFEVLNGAEQRVGGVGEDGRYEVRGVPVGRVRAAVRTSFLRGQAAADRNFATKAGAKADRAALVLVPAKYENPATANLEFAVEPGKPIDLALKK